MSQVYCLVVLEVRNEMGVTGLKSRHQQGWVPAGGARGEPMSLSFWASRAHRFPCLTVAFQQLPSLQPLHPSSCLLLWLLSGLLWWGHPGNPAWAPHLKVFNWLTSAKSLCHGREQSHQFQGFGHGPNLWGTHVLLPHHTTSEISSLTHHATLKLVPQFYSWWW